MTDAMIWREAKLGAEQAEQLEESAEIDHLLRERRLGLGTCWSSHSRAPTRELAAGGVSLSSPQPPHC